MDPMNTGAPAGNPAPATAPAPQGGQKNVLMAVLCYLGILVIVPLVTEAKNDSFVKFHIKQGLVLLIAWVVAGVAGMVPVLGWIAAPFLALFLFILFVIGIINAVSGKEKALPLIGHFGDKIHI